jgi:hypothetical protein
MIEQKTLEQGFALLEPLGLKRPSKDVLKIWSSFFNDVSPLDSKELSDNERLNILPEEFKEACNHLAQTLNRIYPNDNIPCLLLNRIKECRKEKEDNKEGPIKIQSQPTNYLGITFRSKLEAVWALFFDSLGWSYRYEPQQYDIDKYKYKPDFLLPDFDIFIEIKPQDEVGKPISMTTQEIIVAKEKCQLLHLKTKKSVWLIRGNPTPPLFKIFSNCSHDNFSQSQQFTECLSCGSIYLKNSKLNSAFIIEKTDAQKNCECLNIVSFSSSFCEEMTRLEIKATEEDGDEVFEKPLDVDDPDNPESPHFVKYRYNDLILKYLEKSVGTRLKKAHLRTHKLKDDLNVIRPAYSLDNIEYGGEDDHAYELKKLMKEFSKNVLKSFPSEK